MASSLCEEGQDAPVKAADRAAAEAERVGRYLEGSDGIAFSAVVAAGAGLGFVAARMLKASSSERFEAQPARQTPSPSTSPGLPPAAPGSLGNGHPA